MTALMRLAGVVLITGAIACKPATAPTDEPPAANTPPPAANTGVTQLQTVDLRGGAGLEASTGRLVSVHYIGWLYDASRPDNKGQQFDTSLTRGPFSFILGAGAVIRGWDQGVAGMRVGGIRRLTIPPSLGYGSQPNGPIPANSTLVFDVELLEVR
jgi:FKBP-type peptidyl-prolyl cis-trans isomerase FkpA